jgi:hypothetical protein
MLRILLCEEPTDELACSGDELAHAGAAGGGTGCVVFACWSAPLCLFVCRWICKRVPSAAAQRRALSRLYLLFAPMDVGPRAVELCESPTGVHIVTPPRHPTAPIELLVVDESHHVYADPSLRRAVEDLVMPGVTRRLLLADVSQSSGGSIPFPREAHRVSLTEVVRCSRRIVAAAMAFQVCAPGPKLHSACGTLPAAQPSRGCAPTAASVCS